MKIYHELQDSALCGQHCLNNLLQGSLYNAGDLSDIALGLDAKERTMATSDTAYGKSFNVDESGNFSIQVLRSALQYYSIELISWSSTDELLTDPLKEEIGFIINKQSHWFAIRKINNKWWNLNSTLEIPELISSFHLVAFLSQLRSEKYFVFIARGHVPTLNDDVEERGTGRMFEESDLLQGKVGSTTTSTTPAVIPFSGTGRKLGSSDTSVVLTGNAEEDDLARAIAMSLSTPESEATVKLTAKEEMRAKRLAALAHTK
jgi:ataxin-3